MYSHSFIGASQHNHVLSFVRRLLDKRSFIKSNQPLCPGSSDEKCRAALINKIGNYESVLCPLGRIRINNPIIAMKPPEVYI